MVFLPTLLTEELRLLWTSAPAGLGCCALGKESDVTGLRDRKVIIGAGR